MWAIHRWIFFSEWIIKKEFPTVEEDAREHARNNYIDFQFWICPQNCIITDFGEVLIDDIKKPMISQEYPYARRKSKCPRHLRSLFSRTSDPQFIALVFGYFLGCLAMKVVKVVKQWDLREFSIKVLYVGICSLVGPRLGLVGCELRLKTIVLSVKFKMAYL